MEEVQLVVPMAYYGIDIDVINTVRQNLTQLLKTEESVVVSEGGPSSEERNQHSIYKIPEFMIRGGIPVKAFEPQLISFGPYHYGKNHLVRMEREKEKAFRRFVKNNQVDYESILENICTILEDLYRAYDNLDETWKKDDAANFMTIMIVDGCFMLDFISMEVRRSKSLLPMVVRIRQDTLLLENQLPFKLLEQLYDLILQNDKKSLRCLICDSETLGIHNKQLEGMGRILHVLEIYRESLLLYPPTVIKKFRRRHYGYNSRIIKICSDDRFDLDCPTIPQATELRKTGIKFKRSSTSSLQDVFFDSKEGVLKMPRLVVDDTTETTLLNVMAFEKLSAKFSGKDAQVSSFVLLMTNLIQEEKDVSVLTSNGILANTLQNRKLVVDLFNRLAEGPAADILNEKIGKTILKVDMHCNSSWKMWWANLRDPENQNPWVIISIAAASFGFLLQIIQTFYGVYGIYRTNH